MDMNERTRRQVSRMTRISSNGSRNFWRRGHAKTPEKPRRGGVLGRGSEPLPTSWTIWGVV